MDTCGLTPTNREEILGKLRSLKLDLAQRYAISQIGVFGSVSRAEATEASDIDIVVHMQPDMLKRACLKAELERIFGRRVDVVRYWYGMNTYLKNRIDQEAVYV